MITILKNNIITDKLVFEAKDVETQYIMLVDGLMRTAMNYAFNHFINKCTVNMQSETVWNELLKRGFVQNNDNHISDIDNFFTSHKSCKK